MRIDLKPLDEQVVVVLGASSGIGRASSLQLAARGAKVVVSARSEEALGSLVAEITGRGGEATSVVADVVDFDQVQHVASVAAQTYGRIDTWVNCAAVSVFAGFQDTTPDEFRRLSEVNYLGQVHGALAALPHLRASGRGAIIAVSSLESIVSLPNHAAYSASKHAVEGAMDALRRDLMVAEIPVSVTSVKPATINTPLFSNSRNKMDVKPKGPPPYYQPNVVVDCVVYAAEHPVCALFAGGSAPAMAITQFLAPRLMDRYLSRIGVRQERTTEPAPIGTAGNLDQPSSDPRVEGDFSGRARRFSLLTWSQMHPKVKTITASAVLLGAPLAISRLSKRAARSSP
jgi:NAD(P)-dependent dehydrogenase (short-subunit alcohol dehydrogenase family)